MNSPLGGVKPSWDWLCVRSDCPYPPLPLITCLVYGENHPSSLWWAWLPYLNWVLSKVSSVPRIVVIWTCDQLDRFSLIIIIFSIHQTSWERVSWLLFRLSLYLFMVKFSCYLELFSNSHLNIFQEHSPWDSWPASCLAITRTIWSKWTWAWWSLELVSRLLASDNKTSLSRLITLRTFWSEWTWSRWSPLALCKVSLKRLVGFPKLIPATLVNPLT